MYCSPVTYRDTSPVGCEWVNTANAYYCMNITHYMLVFESMDPDTEVRRLSPIALVGGDTARDEYTDLLNGPMDHGMFLSATYVYDPLQMCTTRELTYLIHQNGLVCCEQYNYISI